MWRLFATWVYDMRLRLRAGLATPVIGRAPVRKIRNSLPHQLSTSGGPTLRPLRIWGRRMGKAQSASTLGNLKATSKWQTCHKLVLETGTSLHPQGENTNWSRKPNDIPRMLLASHWLSVVVLTLFSWTMGGNSSTPALSHQILPRLEYTCKHFVLMKGPH